MQTEEASHTHTQGDTHTYRDTDTHIPHTHTHTHTHCQSVNPERWSEVSWVSGIPLKQEQNMQYEAEHMHRHKSTGVPLKSVSKQANVKDGKPEQASSASSTGGAAMWKKSCVCYRLALLQYRAA